jgi:hypothetical protein
MNWQANSLRRNFAGHSLNSNPRALRCLFREGTCPQGRVAQVPFLDDRTERGFQRVYGKRRFKDLNLWRQFRGIDSRGQMSTELEMCT